MEMMKITTANIPPKSETNFEMWLREATAIIFFRVAAAWAARHAMTASRADKKAAEKAGNAEE